MAEKIAEKIRAMAELVNEEHIARSLEIPLEVVQGVLSGEIPDEALKNFDPKNPPDVRLVEKKKFVRSKVIGVASTGGCGATTLTAVLTALSAKKSGLPVAAVDLNEFAGLGPCLGLDTETFIPDITWWNGGNVDDCISRFPELENLSVVAGAPTAERWLETKIGPSFVEEIAAAHAVVWVDCPVSPVAWGKLLPCLDTLLFVVRADTADLMAFSRFFPLLMKNGAEEKTAIVLNFGEKGLSLGECRRALQSFTEIPVMAVLPEDPGVKDAFRAGRCLALSNPKSSFVLKAEEIINVLFPEVSVNKKKRSFLSAIFGGA